MSMSEWDGDLFANALDVIWKFGINLGGGIEGHIYERVGIDPTERFVAANFSFPEKRIEND